MNKLLTRADLLVSSLFINLLGLALPVYVIQSFTRYLSNGFDETLYALTLGVLVALLFEFSFKHYRLKSLIFINSNFIEQGSFFDDINKINLNAPNLQGLPHRINAVKNSVLSVDLKSQTAILDAPYSFVYFFVIYLISPIAALIFFVMVLLALVANFSISEATTAPKKSFLRLTENARRAQKTILNKSSTIELFSNFKSQNKYWRQAENSRLREKIAIDSNAIKKQNLNTFFLFVAITLIVFTSAIEVFDGNLDISALIALNILVGRAFSPMASLPDLISHLISRRKNLDLDKMSIQSPVRANSHKMKSYTGKVEFKAVSQSYPNQSVAVLSNLSFVFQPGSTTVITGGNSTGKTTIFNLIAGLFAPTSGLVLIDDVNMEQISREWWRHQIVAVPQEPEFFDDTILNNLLNINPNLSDLDILSALENVGLKKFVDQSQNGVKTDLSANNLKYNLGFRKRLALARASLSFGNLILMDEPTEGLDKAGAKIFYDYLNNCMALQKTVVVLSHDPAIIKGAGTLINLDSNPISSNDRQEN